jgi:hypothetical protein
MKWRKRLYYYVIYLVTITIVLCVIGLYLYHGTPSWYRPPPASDQEVKDAANSADQKLLDLFSWAASAQAQQVRDSKGIANPDEVTVGPKTVTLSDDEVNALFASWNGPENGDWDERISRYFTGGRVFFTSGGIILAGQSPSLGALVSAQFAASVDDQQNFHLSIASLRAGMLPIPQSAAAPYFQRLEIILQDQLSNELPYVNIDRTMTANGYALASCWIRLLLAGLSGEPADSNLIIPFDLAHLNRGLPVKLSAISLDNGQITITLQPLSPEERQPLIDKLSLSVPGSP